MLTRVEESKCVFTQVAICRPDACLRRLRKVIENENGVVLHEQV